MKENQPALGSSCLSRRGPHCWTENKDTEDEREEWPRRNRNLSFRYHLLGGMCPIVNGEEKSMDVLSVLGVLGMLGEQGVLDERNAHAKYGEKMSEDGNVLFCVFCFCFCSGFCFYLNWNDDFSFFVVGKGCLL